MNLCVDQGNGHCHAVWFDNDEIIHRWSGDNDEIATIKRETSSLTNTAADPTLNVIYCSVSEHESSLLESFARLNTNRVIRLNATTPLPIKVDYDRNEMGTDRVAAAVGASRLFRCRDCLIIDMGTAVTYDVISCDRNGDVTLEGGNIAPGLEMRLRALHEQTSKLPLVVKDGDAPLTSHNTHDAIRGGAINGMMFELIGYAQRISQTKTNLLTILTGGDGKYFEKRMKSEIFASELTYEPNLVEVGLNAILEYDLRTQQQ